MLKTILIFALIIFILSRLGGFLFRAVFWLLGGSLPKPTPKDYQRQPPPSRKPEGSIHVDYVPGKDDQKRRPANFGGGEYVDYEEVK
jgi:hypothetical protein